MEQPTFTDVLRAQGVVRRYLPRTPLHTYPAVNALIGAEVYLKHENYQPVGALRCAAGSTSCPTLARTNANAA
jgi:threonine dehydratase